MNSHNTQARTVKAFHKGRQSHHGLWPICWVRKIRAYLQHDQNNLYQVYIKIDQLNKFIQPGLNVVAGYFLPGVPINFSTQKLAMALLTTMAVFMFSN